MLNKHEEIIKKILKHLPKKAVVIHSGKTDSSLCLAPAMWESGRDAVISLCFRYQQRHSQGLAQAAAALCRDWSPSPKKFLNFPKIEQVLRHQNPRHFQ